MVSSCYAESKSRRAWGRGWKDGKRDRKTHLFLPLGLCHVYDEFVIHLRLLHIKGMKENMNFKSSKTPSETLFTNRITTDASSNCAARQLATSGAAQYALGTF